MKVYGAIFWINATDTFLYFDIRFIIFDTTMKPFHVYQEQYLLFDDLVSLLDIV